MIRSVNDRNPAFITLQEACSDWTTYLDDHLPNHTVKFDPVAGGDGLDETCNHPSKFGNAILYRNDLGADVAQDYGHSLGSPGHMEQREMLCVRFEFNNFTACSAHLTAGGDGEQVAARRAEALVARDILATTYAGSTHFLGSDLNVTPLSDVAGTFYHTGYSFGATGGYKEVDSPCGNDIDDGFLIAGPPYFIPCRGGETTHDDWLWFEEGSPTARKIDFIFVTPTVSIESADATTAIHSDHDPLWAVVSF